LEDRLDAFQRAALQISGAAIAALIGALALVATQL